MRTGTTPTWSSIQATIIGLLLALSVQVPLRMGVFSFAGAGAYGIGAYAGAILLPRLRDGAAATIAALHPHRRHRGAGPAAC